MPTITFFLSAPRLKALLALSLAVTLIASESAAATPGPFRNFIGEWSGRGQLVGSNGHQESMRCRGRRLRGQRRRGGQSGDRVRQRKLQVRHQEPRRSLRRVGQGILERSLSKRVRKSHRADRGEPTRRPDQLDGFQRRDIADIEWPNAGSQHSAQRRRRRRRAHRP